MWQMSTDDSYGGGGGGGFDVSGQFGSPAAGQGDKKPARAHTIIPVTVRQVLESSEDGLKIGDNEVQKPMVRLVGIVKAIEVSSIRIMYTLEDNTGSLSGMFWIDADETDSEATVPVVENTYCSMSGTIRTQGGTKHIMVFNIHPITDLNEVTAHILQVIHISLKAEQVMDQEAQPSIKQEMASSYGNQNEKFINNFGLNPQQQRVYRAISQCPSEGGATVEYISSVLTTKMPPKEISKIIEFLVNEGHAYSAIDDFHFKSTENASF